MRAAAEPRLGAFYAYQAAANGLFFQPIFFLYYGEAIGLAVPAVLWLQSYTLALRSLLELPLGALADRWSRRGCLVASVALVAAAATALVLVPSVTTAVLAETAFAVAHALRSGADSALLHDALAEAGMLARYPEAEGRARAVGSLGAGTAAILGGLMADGTVRAWIAGDGAAHPDLRLPYAAAAVTSCVAAVMAARLPERRRGKASGGGRGRLMREAAAVAARERSVRWTIALAVLAVVSSHVYYFLQQPYLLSIGAPIATFGAVFAGTKIVTAATASMTHRVDAALGPRTAAALMTLVPVAGLAGMAAVTHPAGAILIGTRGILDGLWEPLLNVYMNRLAPTRLRATLLSLQNLAARLGLSLALALLGVATGAMGLRSTLAIAAAGTAVLGALLVASARPAASACRTDAV